jgi:hypothetical protein
MKFFLALLSLPLFAAVDGTVVNQTTGQPQPNVIIQLIQPGQQGMQTLGTAKSDNEGKFLIDKETGENPALLQAIYGGVTYTKMVPPGAPPTGIELPVFDSTNKAGTASLNQHMILLQPDEKAIQVSEMYLLRNTGKVTFNDPAKGALQFYAAPGHSEIKVTVAAPGGMPVQRAASPAGAANTFKVDYPVKPGETRFDVNYTLDSESKEFTGKTLLKGGDTRIVVPDGVTLTGDGLEELGSEPTTKAKIYGLKSDAYKVNIAGTGSLSLEGAREQKQAGAPEEDTGQPQIQQTMPRIYEKLPFIMGLAGAILALGFIVLYRSRKA